MLKEIGQKLNSDRYPRVFDFGIVMPCDSGVTSTAKGEVNNHGKSRERRPATRARQRSARGEGSPARSGTSRRTPPVSRRDIEEAYRAEIAGPGSRSYPGIRAWYQTEGLWLRASSHLLSGLGRSAVFLVFVPFDPGAMPRAWGFWFGDLMNGTWIGPRHTNYPDGSICAFLAQDRTWMAGNSIIKLLDIFSLWALRHLHLEVLGYWPGRQAVFDPYERMLESKDEELCGCDRFGKRYGECCKAADRASFRLARAIRFNRLTAGGRRIPPTAVMQFLKSESHPPSIKELQKWRT